MIYQCFNCGADLTPADPDIPQRRKTDDKTFAKALHIRLSGGYGEFIDGHVDIVICNTCAFHLVNTDVFMKRAIDQYLDV